MPRLTRRRFVAITAAAAAAPAASAGHAAGLPPIQPAIHQWRGIALGARATITLAHPDPARIVAMATAEIARLEAVFSLYREDSDLSRLNAAGRLDRPAFDLLECLSLCNTVHHATGGRFDPTVQRLWATWAEHQSRGHTPGPAAIARALARTGWPKVTYEPFAITLAEPGMALTLNGIAQGYIADRVAALLAAEGLTDILVETGEYRALGGHPEGDDWRIALARGEHRIETTASLRDAALASSAPRGTTFDRAGKNGHILDPVTGWPAQPPWRLVTLQAPRAALADALSTAMCLMTRAEIDQALARFPTVRLVHLG